MGKKPRILIVDDDPEIRFANVMILRHEGYEIIEAATGEEGLQRVREEHPDLVLLDVMLPGINGFEACSRIKEDPATSDVLVVLISALEVSSDSQVEGLDSGADGYITRPIHNRELLARIRSYMRLREAEETLRDSKTELAERVKDRTAELAKANEELKRSEDRFRAIADYGYDWETWLGPDGRLLWTNPAVERITGYTREEYESLADRWESILLDEDRDCLLGIIQQALDRRLSANDIPARIRHKNGSVRSVSISYQPIFGADGRYLGIRGSIRDVTDRRNVEAEAQRLREDLARVSRFSTLGELAAAIAHQLNQPLTAIFNNAQAARRFLEREDADLAEVREALADIVADDRRAAEVIQRLRALFKKGEVQEEVTNVNQAIEEVILLHSPEASEKRVTVDLQLASDLPRILGDPIQLQQVVSNLLTNGMEAMRDTETRSRRITVRTSMVDPDSIQVSVQDSGCGMNEAVRQRVFEPFFTTKAEGMGMGLAVSRSIVESHGGSLWVENNTGPGVTFHFKVPIRKGKKE